MWSLIRVQKHQGVAGGNIAGDQTASEGRDEEDGESRWRRERRM